VLSPVVKKDGKEGGAWPLVGGALPSFAEVVRSEVKLRTPLIERSGLDFLPAMRPAVSEEVRRIPLDCSVMEKDPLGKDLLLNLQSKRHPARLLSAQGTPGSTRLLTWPRLNVWTWNILVKVLSQVVGSFVGHPCAFGLALKPTSSVKGFRLGRVLTKPKAKKWTEVTGQGRPVDPEAGFEFSLGFGSSSGLQRPEVMTAVDIDGGLSSSTSSERS
jgi:hypothetical protein